MEVVYGQTKKRTIADKLVATLQALDLEGTLYIGYPVLASADEPVSVDALLICKQHGLIAFAFELTPLDRTDHASWETLSDAQDRLYFAIQTYLAKHDALRKGRELGVRVGTITLVPVLQELPDRDGRVFTDMQRLPETLKKFPPLPSDYEKPLNAALQRVSTIRPPKKRSSIRSTTSRGAVLRKLEKEIANLDQWQKDAAIGSPEGPQQIRGIAGSGKTVVLALKAAYLHAKNPDWDIVVTFHTRSLYQQFRDLILRFSFEHLGDEPDWSKLHILHAWGGGEKDGIYTAIALSIGVTPMNFLYGKSKYGRQKAFAGVCEELLLAAGQQMIEPLLYDAVLIDEAQDLPPAFLELVWKFTREPKRIIFAYDELQNLSETTTPPPEELFGTDANGRPHVQLSNVEGQARQDIILPVCYRNTPWALTLAHALGFGIYREEGLVQHFDEPDLWGDIGYGIVEGTLSLGAKVVLERAQKSYPSYLNELLSPDDAVGRMVFRNRIDQAEWVAEQIRINLGNDELEPDDILVILPNALTARREASVLIEALSRRKIPAHLAGVTTSRDEIFNKRSIALANIHRAKGNEAPMVYVLSSQVCLEGYGLIGLRNTLFTAITRSRAWVRLCGWGPSMEKLTVEIDEVIKRKFRLEFPIPTRQELEKLRTIHRERTASELERIKKAEMGLEKFLEAVQRGELPIEALPLDIRTKLTKLLESLTVEPDDF
jgi:superfamily I DNA and RNA helicase